MKLLFDENLSYHLVRLLGDMFPHCEHVRNVGLNDADDQAIWEYARWENFIIVSKDADFLQRSFLLGHPPKVIWIRLGNCSTKDVESGLRRSASEIELFVNDEEKSLLILTLS